MFIISFKRIAMALIALGTFRSAMAERVQLQALPFDLSDVRLLDSPFKVAQDADAKYLASLDLDRLLNNFRVNASLPSTAKPLGGWEAPTCELRGHFVGHYLSACSLMFKSTGDPQWKSRVDYLVTELGKCQDALATGYLSAFPDSFFDKLETGQRVWAPYYTIHKIMAGLFDAYRLCGNQQALAIDNKMAAYFAGRIARLSPETIDRIFHTSHGPGTEFGGMSEVLHDLYAVTNDPATLALANTFDRDTFANPLASGEDRLAGIHANTHIPQVDGFALHYQVTADTKYRLAAEHFWEIVTEHHSFVTGSNSFAEHFKPPGVEAAQLSPTTAETCNVYNMLKLTRHLFEWNPKSQYADYYERALYNHILGSIDPSTGMMIYFLSLAPGHFKVYCTPTESFWCCTGTGVENHAKYGDSIYFHNGSTLWVNLFIPSELHWNEMGLKISQITSFPKEPATTLLIQSPIPKEATIKLRVPYWVGSDYSVRINGDLQSVSPGSDGYINLTRRWADADRIVFLVPPKLKLYHAADLKDYAAVLYGPIVLAGDFGTEAVPNPPEVHDQNELNKVPGVPVPLLAPMSDDPGIWLKPVSGQPLTFRTAGVGRPQDVTMQPLYEIHRQRYTVYWKLQSTQARLDEPSPTKASQ